MHRILPGDLAGRQPEPDRALVHVGLAFGEEAVGGFLVALHAEGGIRTPDRGISPYNGLANRRLQPLGHLSNCLCYLKFCRHPSPSTAPFGYSPGYVTQGSGAAPDKHANGDKRRQTLTWGG